MKYVVIGLLIFCSWKVAAQTPDSLWIRSLEEQQLKDSSDIQRFDYHFYQGQMYAQRLHYQEAINEYGVCIAIDSKNAQAHFEISKMYQFLGDTQTARQQLLEAIRLAPDNSYFKEIEAAYCIQAQDFVQAIAIFEKLAKKHRGNDLYLYRLIELYSHTNQYGNYLATLDRLEVLHGITEEIAIAKIEVFELQNKSKKIIAEMEKLIAKYPFETRYQVSLSDYYFDKKQPAKALAILDAIFKRRPNDGYASMAMFAYYQMNNQPEKASGYLMQALVDRSVELDEKLTRLRPYLAELSQQKLMAEADSLFELLLAIYPDHAQVFTLHGEYLAQHQRMEEAEKQFRMAATIEPENEENWVRLALLQSQKTDISSFAETVKEAEKRFPQNTFWAYYRVIIAYQQELPDTVIMLVERYVAQLDGNEKEVKSKMLGMRGDLFVQQNKIATAFADYDSALILFPQNIIVLNNYAYHLALCNSDLRRAERMSGQAVNSDPQNATYLDTYAWVFFMQGDYRSAQFYMERALNYDKGDVLLEHYGDILFLLGREEEALEQWEQSREAGNKSDILTQKIAEKKYIVSQSDGCEE
ncbi:MAG: hypothetical protein LBS16_04630 [Prevotellaceae bacterium]|jgi:tetratricopeptide (TPR) repeat protein|nr:hypothetical protein [Prevotellaceae bacterium]